MVLAHTQPTAFKQRRCKIPVNTKGAPDDAKVNATTLLSANKSFVQEETIQFVNDKYIFNYNETKCRRDLQFIFCKRLRWDTATETNYLGRIAAPSYPDPIVLMF